MVGLSSTLLNILGFLNLAELGITTVISASLYKPLFNNDKTQIIDIVSIFGFLFYIIGTIILIAGIILSGFLPLIFSGTNISLSEIYMGYYMFLGSSLIGYFANYKQNILDADQKHYILTCIVSSCNLLKLITQIVILKWLNGGYMLWISLEFIYACIASILINKAIRKHYPWLTTSWRHGYEIKKNYRHVFSSIKQIIPHKVGTYVLNQTDSLLVFAFISLSMVTVYTNYTTIITGLVLLTSSISYGIIAGVGNLIAEGNRTKIQQVFWEFQSIFCLFAGILTICLFFTTESFITLWLGENFLLPHFTFYLMLIPAYINLIRIPISIYLNGYILYKDTWAPWVEAGTNLIFSILFGYLWGIEGIIFGKIISLMIIAVLWKPYFLYREKFKKPVSEYWKRFGIYTVLLGTAWIVTAWIHSLLPAATSFKSWTTNTGIIFFVSALTYTGLMFVFVPETRHLFRRLHDLIRQRTNR